ncbi:MAG: trimethylamine methyltransferase family protein [Thermoanaerobaculia bacterium]|nr:trimethylamine methyltransferase family protein [Thermoanaerobaculia bacterium]MBP9822784.1 trimethylamine methyltransferase family protein [Thermoanaerobaculia bacterium]
MRPRLELLSREELDLLLEEAFRVLERIGVRIETEAATTLLLAAGAVQRDGRVLLPATLVHAALATAPPRFALYDRAGSAVVELGSGRTSFDPGSAAIYRIDGGAEAGSRAPGRRAATTDDVIALVRLVDGLPAYAAQATALVPGDVPDAIADRWRLYLALRFGAKPVVTGTFSTDGFAPMLAMLRAVRGGERALRERPLALFDCCPTSPLTWSDLTATALMDAARAGVPANLVAVPMTGATAPVTLRGALVQLAAENLAGVAIHQLACPGAPLVWGGAPSAFDMRHGSAAMGAIESAMLNVANARVGRALGLPTHGYLGLSDAKIADYQAGMESATGALLGALAGIDLVSGPGLLDFLLSQSLEKLLLDHEACRAALRCARGIDCAPCDTTLDLLGDLVRTGELLSHPHTRSRWKAELQIASPLIDRESHGDWVVAGSTSAVERARAELARRPPPGSPLADDTAAELTAILSADAARHGVHSLPVV